MTDIIQHISDVREYCRDHLGITLEEFWLSQERADALAAQIEKDVKLVEDPALAGNTDLIIWGMVIKTVGVHDRKCLHLTKSHFQDVNEIYCHDCRTIIGEGVPATHRRHSNVGTNS